MSEGRKVRQESVLNDRNPSTTTNNYTQENDITAHNLRFPATPNNTPSADCNSSVQRLKIMLTNARSVNSKIDELKATAFDLNPEIIAITESWTNETICNSFLGIPGYKLVTRKDRTDTANGRGGGILVYAKTKIMCHEIATPPEIVQVTAMQIKASDLNLELYVVYRSPNSTAENNSRLNDLIRKIPRNSLIIGDFNYPSIDWELMSGNAQATEFLDAVGENFLTQQTVPTKIREAET